jgi:hypothetical protein
VTRVTSLLPAAWEGERIDEIKAVSRQQPRSHAMQTRLTNIAQRYPALAASVSLLAVIAFYVAASSAFA